MLAYRDGIQDNIALWVKCANKPQNNQLYKLISQHVSTALFNSNHSPAEKREAEQKNST